MALKRITAPDAISQLAQFDVVIDARSESEFAEVHVLLHQAVQRGLFRAVALEVGRGAMRRPLALPADGLHARLPRL